MDFKGFLDTINFGLPQEEQVNVICWQRKNEQDEGLLLMFQAILGNVIVAEYRFPIKESALTNEASQHGSYGVLARYISRLNESFLIQSNANPSLHSAFGNRRRASL